MDIAHIYEAKSDEGWGFKFYIEKAVAEGDVDNMIITGIASTMNVDHDGERMALPALESMANIINEKSVPLRIEHQKDDSAIVGNVNKAWIDERKQLWIQATLKKDHAAAPILYGSLKSGAKLGLSVGGRVKSAIKELVESVGKQVKTFYNVALDEVSVTTRPANFDAWLTTKLQKNISSDEVEKSRNSELYKEFLFENQQLDYLRAIEKSVPASEFREVETKQINNKATKAMSKKVQKEDSSETTEDTKESTKAMDSSETEETKTTKTSDTTEETETKEKSEKTEETETTKSFVTRSEFREMTKAISDLTTLFSKAMEVGAMDTTNPDSPKDKESTETTAKAREGKTDTEGNGEQEGKDAKEVEAMEQTNPSKEKPYDAGQQLGKKGSDSETTDTYELKSIRDCIKRIGKLSKAMDGSDETTHSEDDTKTKSERSSETETETTKSVKMSDIDQLAIGLTAFMEKLQDRVEKSGKNIPGLTEALIDIVRNDPQIQESISKAMKEPGIKKSVSMGIPYMVDKTGKRYALTAHAVDTVEKSEKPQNFQELWKTQLTTQG